MQSSRTGARSFGVATLRPYLAARQAQVKRALQEGCRCVDPFVGGGESGLKCTGRGTRGEGGIEAVRGANGLGWGAWFVDAAAVCSVVLQWEKFIRRARRMAQVIRGRCV